jgi:hypothetical protein
VQQQEDPVKRILMSAAALFALAALVAPAGAQAQCWFDGFATTCAPVAPYYVPSPYFYGSPYAAWNSWDFRDYRVQPDWLPTYPGPRPGR